MWAIEWNSSRMSYVCLNLKLKILDLIGGYVGVMLILMVVA